MKTIQLKLLAAALVLLGAPARPLSAAVSTNLFDDFSGSSLDTSKWTTTVPADVSETSGYLQLCAACNPPNPVNVTSLQMFKPISLSATEQFTLDVRVLDTRTTFAGFSDGAANALEF